MLMNAYSMKLTVLLNIYSTYTFKLVIKSDFPTSGLTFNPQTFVSIYFHKFL